MKSQDFKRLLDKYVLGQVSKEEAGQVDDFVDYLQTRKMPENLTEEKIRELGDRAFLNMSHKLNKSRKSRVSWWRYAAVILVLITSGVVASLLIGNGHDTLATEVTIVERSTEAGERSRVQLPDGSVVILNVGSKISYPQKFSDSIRAVHLEGEAYFDVAHNEQLPFVVQSGSVNTTVLGTSFNINARNLDKPDVTLVTGKVQVSFQDQKLILKPGMQASLSGARKLIARQVDLQAFTSWKDAELEFDLMPFDEVLRRLSRWYNVEMEITGDSGKACLVRTFVENQSLEQTLDIIRDVVSFEYQIIDESTYSITYHGCKD